MYIYTLKTLKKIMSSFNEISPLLERLKNEINTVLTNKLNELSEFDHITQTTLLEKTQILYDELKFIAKEKLIEGLKEYNHQKPSLFLNQNNEYTGIVEYAVDVLTEEVDVSLKMFFHFLQLLKSIKYYTN